MGLIEVLLRLGCALVAWMVIYTHIIWTATLRVTGCEADGDQLWRLLLGFAPFALGFCALINVSHKLPEVHRILAWLATPMVLLIPLALLAVAPWLLHSSIEGLAICSDANAALWHRLWAPVQLLIIAAIVLAIWRVWRNRYLQNVDNE